MCVVSVNVSPGFESDLDHLGESIVGILQQFTKRYTLVFRPSVFVANVQNIPVNSPEYLAKTLSISARWFTSTHSSSPESHYTGNYQGNVGDRTVYSQNRLIAWYLIA